MTDRQFDAVKQALLVLLETVECECDEDTYRKCEAHAAITALHESDGCGY